jgi:hypothetical protein
MRNSEGYFYLNKLARLALASCSVIAGHLEIILPIGHARLLPAGLRCCPEVVFEDITLRAEALLGHDSPRLPGEFPNGSNDKDKVHLKT